MPHQAGPNPISILAVDAQPIFLQGLASVLRDAPGLRLAALAGDGAGALAQHRLQRPDVTLLGTGLPGADADEVVRRIRRDAPEARIIVLAVAGDVALAAQAIRAGAAGCIDKRAQHAALVEAIHAVHGGLRRISPEVACALAARLDTESLSDREVEVLRLVADGNTNARIAERLSLAEGTVRRHVQSVLGKLQAKDRAHAVFLGLLRGLISA